MSSDNNNDTKISEQSPSVHAHLSILQSVIQRMAANSASCKTWCITIVSAILVLVADKQKPELFWLAMFPIPVFAILDVYYLGLERGFRDSYNAFVSRLHNGRLTLEDLYAVTPSKNVSWLRAESIMSFSILGFYIPLALLAFIAKSVVT